jgi:PAS domain S-box-containing protein
MVDSSEITKGARSETVTEELPSGGPPNRDAEIARSRTVLVTGSLAIAVFVAALIGIAITRQSGRIASIWLANGVVLAALVKTRRASWLGWIAAGFGGNLLADLVSGDALPTAMALSLCNTAEIGIAALFMGRGPKASPPDLAEPGTLVRFLLVGGILAPAVSSLLAVGALHALHGEPYWPLVRIWFSADALGLVTVVPLIVGMTRQEVERALVPPIIFELLAVALGITVAIAWIVGTHAFNLLILITPLISVAVLRLGYVGATLSLFLMTATGVAAIALVGDHAEAIIGRREQVELLQLAVFANVVALLPTASLFRARARTEERLAITLRSIGDGVIVTDRAANVTSLNEAAEALTGWTTQEAKGRPLEQVFRIVHEETRGEAESPVRRVLREGRIATLANHTALLARDGREWSIADSASPIRDPLGDIDGVVMVFRDQSAERRADKLLGLRLHLLEYAPSHSLHELMQRGLDVIGEFTGSPLGFFHFVESDQQTLSLQAWSTRTVRECSTGTAAGAHYATEQAGVWADALRERRPVIHDEYASVSNGRGLPEGHVVVVRELVVPVMRDDKVVAILGVGNKPEHYTSEDVQIVSYLADVCWEITARKRAEAIREQLEAQLRQAQKLESIGRLAGGIAHDFNNLLTVILACSESQKEAHARGQASDAQDAQEIHDAALRARELTRRLLAFARKQSASPVIIDLGAAVTSIEGLLGRVLGDEIELVTDVEAGIWQVQFDPGQLEQVFMNLAVNARDAMPNGGTLRIKARNEVVQESVEPRREGDRPGEWVRVSFRDTGVGMSPETLGRLFEPFFTTKDVGRGTGLGLATVHGIVSQTGGHIHVESAVGQGSVFEICLPRATGHVLSTSADECASSQPGAMGNETVLVVEDEPVVRNVIVRTLRRAGYRVVEHGQPTDAVEFLREIHDPIHLIVSDVRMPGRSGPSMVEEMRRIRPDLRALFVSGHPGNDHDFKILADPFLDKPFTAEQLLAKVREVIAGASRA